MESARSWWVPAVRGRLGIVLAVLAIAWPGLTLPLLVVLFAGCAILAGVAWRGVAWRGVAWRGVAWRGVGARRAGRRAGTRGTC